MADKQPAQKVSAWEKAKHGGKATFDKAWAGFEKLGVPVNKFTNKIGSEAFWPTQLGPESDKAARILKSFCKDGFYTEQPPAASGSVSPGPTKKPKVLVKIPQKVIQNAVGLAIFSTMRTGLWVSGAGGSGVLIARKEDGTWSPPSGILIHTLGIGWMVGVDIYDCVLVINNRKALEAFNKVRLSIGGEISVVAGPVGTGGVVESELLKSQKPVFSYMKSRGLYAGVQADGTIIIERNDENARFYGERVPVASILAGHVKNIPPETRLLAEVVKQAEGRTDVNQNILQEVDQHPPPSDIDVEHMTEPTPEQKTQFAPPAEGYYAPQSQEYPPDYKHATGATQTHTGEGSHGYPADYKHPSGATQPPSGSSEQYYPPPPPGPPPNNTQGASHHAGATGTSDYYPPPPPGPPPSTTHDTAQSSAHTAQHSTPQIFFPPPPTEPAPKY